VSISRGFFERLLLRPSIEDLHAYFFLSLVVMCCACSKKNINCSIDESLKRFEEVVLAAKKEDINVRGSVSNLMSRQAQTL